MLGYRRGVHILTRICKLKEVKETNTRTDAGSYKENKRAKFYTFLSISVPRGRHLGSQLGRCYHWASSHHHTGVLGQQRRQRPAQPAAPSPATRHQAAAAAAMFAKAEAAAAGPKGAAAGY